MDRMLFTAMSGAKQSLDQQAVVSHNLANVVTPGFRAQLMDLQAVPVDGEGLATRASVRVATTGADFTPGPVTRTGRGLDVALDGNAWLAVQAADGSEAYTRRGDVQIDGNGMMMVAGHPVLGDGGPLMVPLGSEVMIGADGTVSVVGEGQDPDTSAAVGRLKLASAAPGELERGEDGLFRAPAGADGTSQPLAADKTARLVSGALEGSNVSAVEAMVAMIDNARRYEMQMKTIASTDDNEERANSLLSLQG